MSQSRRYYWLRRRRWATRKIFYKKPLSFVYAELRTVLTNSGHASPMFLRTEKQLLQATIEHIKDLENALATSIAGRNASVEDKNEALTSVRESFYKFVEEDKEKDKSRKSLTNIDIFKVEETQPKQRCRRRLNFDDIVTTESSVSNDYRADILDDFLKTPSKSQSIFQGFENTYSKLAAGTSINDNASVELFNNQKEGNFVYPTPTRIENDVYPSGSSLLGQLHRRQYDAGRHPLNKAWYRARRIAQKIMPNLTVADVRRRFIFPRRFSPDGGYLIAFNTSQVLVYQFLGTARLAAVVNKHLSTKPTRDKAKNNTSRVVTMGHDYWVRASALYFSPSNCGAFDSCFKKIACVDVGLPAETLSRDVALFTAAEGYRYLIVASMYPGIFFDEDLPPPSSAEQQQTSESLPIRNPSVLQHVTLHMIDIFAGVICDSVTFKCDIISLSSANPGVCLVDGERLAVLSIQHQTVQIFDVASMPGRFRPVCKLGPFGSFPDDQLLIQSSFPGANNNHQPANNAGPISTLKHRILSYMYFYQLNASGQRSLNMLKFHSQVEDVINLRMFRMQLLDREHVLIKLAPERVLLAMLGQAGSGGGSNIGASVSIDAASSNSSAATAAISAQLRSSSLLVIYSLVKDQVISVLQDGSDATLDFVVANADCILAHTASSIDTNNHNSQSLADRNSTHPLAGQAALRVPTNCQVAKCIFAQHRRVNSRLAAVSTGGGGRAEANCRAMAAFLFVPSQSHSPSPYVDYSLFAFDDRLLSPMMADAKPRQLTPVGSALRLFYPTTGHSACRFFVSCGPNTHPLCCPCQEFTSHNITGGDAAAPSQQFPFRTLVSTVIHPTLPVVLSYTRLVPTDHNFATTPMDLLNLHIHFSPPHVTSS